MYAINMEAATLPPQLATQRSWSVSMAATLATPM